MFDVLIIYSDDIFDICLENSSTLISFKTVAAIRVLLDSYKMWTTLNFVSRVVSNSSERIW